MLDTLRVKSRFFYTKLSFLIEQISIFQGSHIWSSHTVFQEGGSLPSNRYVSSNKHSYNSFRELLSQRRERAYPTDLMECLYAIHRTQCFTLFSLAAYDVIFQSTIAWNILPAWNFSWWKTDLTSEFSKREVLENKTIIISPSPPGRFFFFKAGAFEEAALKKAGIERRNKSQGPIRCFKMREKKLAFGPGVLLFWNVIFSTDNKFIFKRFIGVSS